MKVTGDRPPPCHSFTLTMISRTKAVLFGGLEAETNQCLKDVYVAELTKESVVSGYLCSVTTHARPCENSLSWQSQLLSFTY